MEKLPHIYKVKSNGEVSGNLVARATNLPDIIVTPPAQFGGPGDQWSPEDLLMASVANCLVLSFRAIAKASKFQWLSIECESEGTLDKIEGKLQFTDVTSTITLSLPSTENESTAKRLLHKAEETCLISNSLSCESKIECVILFHGE